MSVSLDIVILIVFVLFVLIGVHRGFVRSAAHFLGSVIAAGLASAFGGLLANWVFNTMFRDALVRRVSESISSLGLDNASDAMEKVLSSLPDFIVRALEGAGVTAATLEGALVGKTGEAAELVADSLAPVFINFLKVLAVLVLFLLFMMVVRALADMLSKVFYLPGLRQLNGLLGGVFGFLLALVSVWVVISAVQVFIPMLSADLRADVQIALDRSVIAGWIVRLNPLGVMF